MKVFVSQPMRGRSESDILSERNGILEDLGWDYDDVEETPRIQPKQLEGNSPLSCLGLSLQLMAQADMVVFAPGWEKARGCLIEFLCCRLYDKEFILYNTYPSSRKKGL